MKTSAIKIFKLLILVILLIPGKNILAQTNLANVSIVAGATNTGGSFTGTAPNRVWTPTATTSSIGVTNLVTELNSNNVTISTAFTGGTGAGDVSFNVAVTTAGTSAAATTFTINTTGAITVSQAISLTRATPTVAGTLGYPGVNVNFSGASLTVSAAISANGGNGRVGLTTGNAAARTGTNAGAAGAITLTSTVGALTISAALNANGGNGGGGDNGNPSGNGGNGGTITLNSSSSSSLLNVVFSNIGGTGGVGSGGSANGTSGTIGAFAGSGSLQIGAATNLTYAPSSVNHTGLIEKVGAGTLTFGNIALNLDSLTISAGTFTATSATTTLTGNFINNATFAPNGGTLLFAGTSRQSIGGIATTFQNISITNSAGVQANADMTVNGVLNLGAGDPANMGLLNMIAAVGSYGSLRYSTLDGDSILPVALYNTSSGFKNSTNSLNNLNSFVLNLGPSATVTGQGDVSGKIRRTSFVSGTTYAFGGNNMTMTLTSVSGSALPTQVTFVTTFGDSAGLHADKSNAVKRMYQVLRTGGAAATLVTLRLPYNENELNGNTQEDNLVLWDHHLPYAGVTPHEHGKTGNNSGNNWIELAGHSLFYFAAEGDTNFTKYWMIGTREALIPTWLGAAGGGAAGDWNSPSNWTSGTVPPADSAIVIPGSDVAPNAPTILPTTLSMRALEIQSNREFNAGNSIITISGGPAANGGRGSWINSGKFNAGTSTVVFTNPSATLSGNSKFHKLTIANGAAATVGNSTKIEVENTLVVNGSLNTNNNLVLKSYSNGTANIGASAGSITGTVTVERHISANRKFRLLAHPFSTAQPLNILTDSIDLTGNVDGITNNSAKTVGVGFTPTATNNPNAFWFNTATADGNTVDGGWKAFTAADGSGTNNTWGVGQGIRVLVRGRKGQGLDNVAYTPDTVVFNTTGTVNVGNVNITLNTGGTGNSSGYNLVGNPYPSPVDISAVVFASAGQADIQKTIYLRNPVTGGWISQLLVSGTPFIMPAYTAAFIRNIGLSSVTLPFTEARKADASTVTTFKKGSISNALFISLKLGEQVFDNLNIQFDEKANAGFDQGLDAIKLGNDSFNFNAITSNNVHVCTDMRPATPGAIIPLFTNIRKGSTKVTFMVDEFDIDENLQVYLNDQKMSKKVLLEKGVSYEFDINAADNTTFGSTRFFLSLESEASALNEQLILSQAYSLYPNPAKDYINISKQNVYAKNVQWMELMDMNGKVLQTLDMDFVSNSVANIDISHLSSGVYFIKLSGEGYTQTLRFVK